MGVKRQNLLALDLANGKPLWEATAIRSPGDFCYQYHAPWIIANEGVVAEQDGQRQVAPAIDPDAARPIVGRRRNQVRVMIPGGRFAWLDLQSLTLGKPDNVWHWALAESYDIHLKKQDGKERLVCIDADTRQVRWSRPRESLASLKIHTDEALVIKTACTSDDGLEEYAVLDSMTGSTKWSGHWRRYEEFEEYAVALGAKCLVVVSRKPGTAVVELSCADLDSGDDVWRNALQYAVTPIVTGSIIWTVCTPQGRASKEYLLTAWDCTNGKTLSEIALPTQPEDPHYPFIKAVIDDCILVDAGRELLCYQATTA